LTQISWDEDHLHFDVFRRKNGSKAKGTRWDPFDKYTLAPAYADLTQGSHGLWIIHQGQLAFAEDIVQ
jgi:hypothetical protein